MWQNHYALYLARIGQLREEADRERRWRQQDEANGRPGEARTPGRTRVATARAAAVVSRAAGTIARRLDERVAVELEAERILPGA